MTTTTDWAEELQADYEGESARPIRWAEWASQTIHYLENRHSSQYDDAMGHHAGAMLREVAAYLDRQYDSGYDGIALMPLSGFNLSYDR